MDLTLCHFKNLLKPDPLHFNSNVLGSLFKGVQFGFRP
jgi:hypothetical protein